MCGLAGILAFGDTRPVAEDEVRAMRDAIVHRGPDGAGLWLAPDGRIGLGHRRLAIVDLSDAAAQPMADADGTVQLVYNGEIYNHAELRRELEARGHRFRTDHSDTEVVVHGYREWGIDCIDRFRGMFAFALWDTRARRLWLVRDRIGVKPLYYAVHGGRLRFASEIKALLTDPTLPRAVNEEALFHYLSFLTTPAPDTLFEGIRKLPGGTLLQVEADGRMTERRWWDALDARPDVPTDDGAIAERVLAELRTAVGLRKVSDVPVGVFLSGGIDSSANAALFSDGETRPIHTFSIGYDRDYGSTKNELDYARRMAAMIGADHRERRLALQNLIDFLPRMVALQDEPIADPVCVPLYYVSKLARDAGVIVCQVGEGADELFWGYPNWRRAWRLQRLNDRFPVPGIAKELGLAGLRAWGKDAHQPYDWLARARARQPIFWGGAETFTHAEKLRLLAPPLRQQFAERSSWEVIAPIRARWEENTPERSTLNWMSYLDLNFRLPELLLMRVDKMSMGVSLEARVPFLDHRFVELGLNIPEAVKTRGGTLKAVLKRAVRGLIPAEMIDRPKQGFGVPVHEWLLEGLGETVTGPLDRFLADTELLDPAAVRAVIDDPRGRVHAWTLFNLALWWEHAIATPAAAPQPALAS